MICWWALHCLKLDWMGYIFAAYCLYAYFHCLRRGELPNVTKVSRKIPKKTRYVGSRSFKVIEFGPNLTGIYDFLLVMVTLAIACTISKLYRCKSRNRHSDTSLSHLMPSLGSWLANMLMRLTSPETRFHFLFFCCKICTPTSIVLGLVSCQCWQ